MQEQTKSYLPSEWWSIAEVVDAFESECTSQFPSLRPYAQRIDASHQLAALAELVKVDFERRWSAGQSRRIEQYLDEYPELKDSCVSLEELIRYECLVRLQCGDQPSLDELSRRFPQWSKQRLIQIQESAAESLLDGTFGNVQPPAGRASDDGPGSPTNEALPAEAEKPPKVDTSCDPWSTMGPVRESSKPAGLRDTRRRGRSGTRADNGHLAKSAPSEPAPAETRTIGRYQITRKLGSGGFGVVYRCYDEDLERDVAIKVPHKKYSSSRQQRQAFLHEAQTAARLKHPGIVAVLDFDQTEDGRVYIVYEYIEGMTLYKRLKQGGFTHEQAADWVAEVADALHYAHGKGIVHRDVKPSNILLDIEDRPHLADFGLAKKDDQYFRDDTDIVVGSLAYLSPEQATAKSHWATPQSDIYTLGVVFYELLCRKCPFRTTDMKKALAEIKGRAPFPPRTIDDKIPKALEDVCLKAMNKDPADRYTTAADMAADLRVAVAEKPPVRVGRRFLIGAAGAAALALAFKLIPFPSRRPDSSQAPLAPPPIAIPGGGALRLDIHYQAAGESYCYHSLSHEKITLYDGDRVQLHVALEGKPRYVYLYWYDGKGKPQRLWPPSRDDGDVAQQEKVNQVVRPTEEDEDLWYPITPDRGAEMALVAYRDEPLDTAEIRQFEQQVAYREDVLIELHAVLCLTTDEIKTALIERGLGAQVENPKNPVSHEFRDVVQETFDGFYGLIIPHKDRPNGDPT